MIAIKFHKINRFWLQHFSNLEFQTELAYLKDLYKSVPVVQNKNLLLTACKGVHPSRKDVSFISLIEFTFIFIWTPACGCIVKLLFFIILSLYLFNNLGDVIVGDIEDTSFTLGIESLDCAVHEVKNKDVIQACYQIDSVETPLGVDTECLDGFGANQIGWMNNLSYIDIVTFWLIIRHAERHRKQFAQSGGSLLRPLYNAH